MGYTSLVGCVFISAVVYEFNDISYRCIGSCTAHLEELKQPEDLVKNIGKLSVLIRLTSLSSPVKECSWRQFRFSVGAPDAEATFKTQVEAAKKISKNATQYPSLFVRCFRCSVCFCSF